MKLLVTGASGLLGTRVCQIACLRRYDVYSVYGEHAPRFGTPIKLDITDSTAVEKAFEKVKPDATIHAAALSDVDMCEKEKELAWETNVEATSVIARLCSERSCFLIYVSTDYVFNGERGDYKETDPTAPVNYYGLTKLEGEEQVKKSNAHHCIARTSVIYGSIPAAGKVNFALWLMEKLSKREEVQTVVDLWNSPTLNTNLAEMILETVRTRTAGTYHLAGSTRLSRHEFAEKIAESFGLDKKLLLPTLSEKMPWIAKRPQDTSLNVEKATQTLRNKPLQIDKSLSRLKTEISQISPSSVQ